MPTSSNKLDKSMWWSGIKKQQQAFDYTLTLSFTTIFFSSFTFMWSIDLTLSQLQYNILPHLHSHSHSLHHPSSSILRPNTLFDFVLQYPHSIRASDLFSVVWSCHWSFAALIVVLDTDAVDNPRCQKDRELDSASTNLHTARSMLRAFGTCFMEFAPRGVGIALVIWNCLDNPYELYCRCCRVPQYIRSYKMQSRYCSKQLLCEITSSSASILFSCATPTHDLQRSCSSLCICHTLHKIHAQFDLWNVIESQAYRFHGAWGVSVASLCGE